MIVPPRYDYFEAFKKGYSWTVIGVGNYEWLNNNITHRQVKFNGKFGLVSATGNEILPPVADMILELYPDHALIGTGESTVKFMDFPGERVISFNGEIGVLKSNGEMILPVKFTSIKAVKNKETLYWFAKNDSASHLFLDDTLLNIPEHTEDIENFSGGLARFRVNSQYGFINKEGEVVIEPVFEKAGDFKNGKALVKDNETFFYIDSSGQYLKDAEVPYNYVGPFSEGYALVSIMDEYGYINHDSSYFIYPRFTRASPFFNNIAHVATEDSFGYIFTNGKVDIARKYEREKRRPWAEVSAFPHQSDGFDPVPCHSTDTTFFHNPFTAWSIQKLLSITLQSIRWAPYLYYPYPQMLGKVCAGEGTLTGRYDLNIKCMNAGSDSWEKFRDEVIFPLLNNQKLLTIAWGWASPYIKKSYRSMPETHQKIYLEMAEYLGEYYEKYTLGEIREHLTKNEADFAYYHPDMTRSPFRKVSAFTDRLILIHQVMDGNNVKKWIRQIRSDMLSW